MRRRSSSSIARRRSAWRLKVMTRKQRADAVLIGTCAWPCSRVAAGLVLFALRDSIVFFYTPDRCRREGDRSRARASASAAWSTKGSVERGERDDASASPSPNGERRSPSPITACCRTCSAKGRASSPKGTLDGRRPLHRRHRARQARRELHAARGRRALKEQGVWQDGEGGTPADRAALSIVETRPLRADPRVRRR